MEEDTESSNLHSPCVRDFVASFERQDSNAGHAVTVGSKPPVMPKSKVAHLREAIVKRPEKRSHSGSSNTSLKFHEVELDAEVGENISVAKLKENLQKSVDHSRIAPWGLGGKGRPIRELKKEPQKCRSNIDISRVGLSTEELQISKVTSSRPLKATNSFKKSMNDLIDLPDKSENQTYTDRANYHNGCSNTSSKRTLRDDNLIPDQHKKGPKVLPKPLALKSKVNSLNSSNDRKTVQQQKKQSDQTQVLEKTDDEVTHSHPSIYDRACSLESFQDAVSFDVHRQHSNDSNGIATTICDISGRENDADSRIVAEPNDPLCGRVGRSDGDGGDKDDREFACDDGVSVDKSTGCSSVESVHENTIVHEAGAGDDDSGSVHCLTTGDANSDCNEFPLGLDSSEQLIVNKDRLVTDDNLFDHPDHLSSGEHDIESSGTGGVAENYNINMDSESVHSGNVQTATSLSSEFSNSSKEPQDDDTSCASDWEIDLEDKLKFLSFATSLEREYESFAAVVSSKMCKQEDDEVRWLLCPPDTNRSTLSYIKTVFPGDFIPSFCEREAGWLLPEEVFMSSDSLRESLLDRATKKLDCLSGLKVELDSLDEEIGQWEEKLNNVVKEKVDLRQFSKYRSTIDEFDKVTNLLLMLGNRLADTDNSIDRLSFSQSDQELGQMITKRDNLTRKFEEACSIKDIIESRRKQVAEHLQRRLTKNVFASYRQLLKTKCQLVLCRQSVNDRLSVAQEQVKVIVALIERNTCARYC